MLIMQEIKIPEGCKASIDFEKRVVVIESEQPKFKKGDIIISSYFILPFMGINENEAILYNCFYSIANLYATVKAKVGVGCGYISKYRLATPSEQQLLFDALAKEGKKWNAETLQLEDIQKDILVPESIGIYRCKEDFGVDGDGLYISFNNNTQLLYYNSKYKVWCTIPLHSGYERVQCKLTPCKREDLKEGDTAVMYQSCITKPNLDVVNRYYKVLPDDKYARVNGESISVVTIEGSYLFYKVEPINK